MSFPENDTVQCSNPSSFNGNAVLKIINSNPYSPSEDFNAERKPGNSKSSVVRKRPGKKRGPRSMGRYPFLAWANKYLEAYGANYAEATRTEYDRRYRRMNKEIIMLVQKGKMKTSNPKDMVAEDILAYMGFLRSKRLRESAICHDLSALKNLLSWAGNSAVDTYRKKYHSTVPKRRHGRLPSMEEDDLQAIVQSAKKIADNDWKHLQAYSLVLLSACAGLRTKEIRLSRVYDLSMNKDPSKCIFHAERVKGERTYGEPRDIPIRMEAHDILNRYLKLRNELVASKCPGNDALFPALRDRKGDGYFATNSLQKLKATVEKDTGIYFDLRKMRRTFGQRAFDSGLIAEDVSPLMGHGSTKTTEEYYGRRKLEMAIKNAQRVWYNEAQNLQPCAESPLIDFKNEVTGYVRI